MAIYLPAIRAAAELDCRSSVAIDLPVVGIAQLPQLVSQAMENIVPILIADAPEALMELCGLSLLERLLRILQRLGFGRAIVVSSTPESVGAELANDSWAREKIIANLVPRVNGPVTVQFLLEQIAQERFLILPG